MFNVGAKVLDSSGIVPRYVAHIAQFQQTSGISHRMLWKQGLIGLGKGLF